MEVMVMLSVGCQCESATASAASVGGRPALPTVTPATRRPYPSTTLSVLDAATPGACGVTPLDPHRDTLSVSSNFNGASSHGGHSARRSSVA